jgi:hypothetical protein
MLVPMRSNYIVLVTLAKIKEEGLHTAVVQGGY